MKLSKHERLILANQYRILETIVPDEAETYAAFRKIVEHGYELEYGEIAQNISDEVLSSDECVEVIDILDMFSSLKQSYEQLKDKSGIDERSIRFGGFDGNHDKQLGYARYLQEDGRFTEVFGKGDLNSHSEVLPRYRRMLSVWKAGGKKGELSKDDVLAITAESVHPSKR